MRKHRDREPIRIGTFDQVGAAFVRACPKIGISSLSSDSEVFEIFHDREDSIERKSDVR